MRCCAGRKGDERLWMSSKRGLCLKSPGDTRYGGKGDASQREGRWMGTESKGRGSRLGRKDGKDDSGRVRARETMLAERRGRPSA